MIDLKIKLKVHVLWYQQSKKGRKILSLPDETLRRQDILEEEGWIDEFHTLLYPGSIICGIWVGGKEIAAERGETKTVDTWISNLIDFKKGSVGYITDWGWLEGDFCYELPGDDFNPSNLHLLSSKENYEWCHNLILPETIEYSGNLYTPWSIFSPSWYDQRLGMVVTGKEAKIEWYGKC